jgi:CO dehydrogenase maturation factor
MANNILRDVISKLTTNYSYVVVDNEAGMEHLSRRTEEEVDHLFVISDPAPRSLRTIGRIAELIDELGGRIHNKHLVLSRVQGSQEDLSLSIREEIERLPYKPEVLIPYDDTLIELDLQGQPLIKISSDAPSYKAVKNMLKNIGILS